ncbi:MAG: Obg family GTPase CgtA [Candidatus Shapirobacteria bacterium]
MLITKVNIVFKAGDGGDGMVAFYKYRKGPSGGNGERGGSIYLSPTTNIYALNSLARAQKIEAPKGGKGMIECRDGRAAKDLEIKLPVGTMITDKNSREVWEITNETKRFLFCKGGAGGRGNYELRSSTNATPQNAEKGKAGQERDLEINLKLIAQYGLIGFPNAGKSSLLKELTEAHPKIASYPFTTLEPNLGEINGKVIADIPGLIKGASEGKGLGIKFLKHIEKVSLLLHCISCEEEDLRAAYQTIRNELKKYNPQLLKLPEVILLTKTDLKPKAEITSLLKKLKSLKKEVIPVSIHNRESIEKLKKLFAKKGKSGKVD